ncbi:MAG TPA: CYTH domain-containing protein, partial [Roseiflexaceae bacterium]|nr:CYTH domain-containing protein [Roseiflexaceae bacterium]
MQPPPQEIEAKLAIRDDATLRELRTLLARRTLGGYALRPHDAPEQQVNQYFDSADGRLRARLHGLRIRSVGDRHTLTLKGPAQVVGDIHARSEWEQPLERPSLDALPAGPLRDQVEQLSGGAPLHVVVTIHTQRSVIVVSRPSGKRALVEIALDDGRVEANGRSLELREVELELLPGGT